jgi:glycine cleavage system aminomethyltransferase T
MLKRTPLFAVHQKLGARLIDFGGWEMPVQYSGIHAEHHAVRTAAGLFDISHMGEIVVRGGAAPDFLNHVLTNDIRKLQTRQGQYTLMCNERGGTIDDLYVYQVETEEFLLIVNASRISGLSPARGRGFEEPVGGFRGAGPARPKNGGVHRCLFCIVLEAKSGLVAAEE